MAILGHPALIADSPGHSVAVKGKAGVARRVAGLPLTEPAPGARRMAGVLPHS